MHSVFSVTHVPDDCLILDIVQQRFLFRIIFF